MTDHDDAATLTDEEIETERFGRSPVASTDDADDTADTGDDTGDVSDTSDTGDDSGDVSDNGDDAGDDS